MKHRCLLTTVLLVIVACVAVASDGLLPRPRQLTFGSGAFRLSEPCHIDNHTPFSLDISTPLRFVTENTSKIHQNAIILDGIGHFEHPEAYRLHVSPDTIRIAVGTQTGLLRAMQTLSQLASGGIIPAVDITDWPAYTWRGVMIDLSRHLFPLDVLKRQVDVAASYKLNRLHLHLTDAGGWRLQLDGWPLLTERTAWRTASGWHDWWTRGDRRYLPAHSSTGYGGFYTKAEMRELIQYATAHGMEVIPEIEMPGHSEEVLAAYPELTCVSEADSTRHVTRSGDLCLGNPQTYSFLESVLTEVMELFPSAYIHVGGDEAGMTAWRTCPRCQRKMHELGATDVKALQTNLIRHIANFLSRHGRQLLGWDEIIDAQLPNTTVMVWRDAAHARNAIRQGLDVVMAPCANCYFNNWQDAPVGEHADLGYLPLDKAYTFDPAEGMTPAEAAHVQGVQACVWTEFIHSPEQLECHLYPRLLATAEIGWHGSGKLTFSEFREIALKHTARLRAQGINAFDLSQEIGQRPASLKPDRHKAVGAAVTYQRPFSRYYPAAGAATLTDGLHGGWHHGDQRWQGFIGPECIDVTIDLGRRTRIRSISMEFMQNASPDIYLPASLTYTVSDDGQHFRQLWQHEEPKQTKPGLTFHTWEWKGHARARYIRVQGSSHDRNAWIFTDEIVIN